MDAILDAVRTLLDPFNLALLPVSLFAGILVGAAPGLTSTIAIGLLIPFTFGMTKYAAFILLLGIYCGSMYGGSIPAILMNLPGTPTSAITALDGYPMTRKGQGGRALAIAVISSTSGGLISCIFLVFLSLQLATLATLFAGPEYFALCVFAITVVFSLTSSSIVKGVIAVGLGLLLSTVGIDPVTPFPRFTFGIQEILIGIPAVPATIGLFCVAEAFRMVERPGVFGTFQAKAKVSTLVAFREARRLWRTIVRSSLIGTFIGILPGAGAMMASFIAYGESKRRSRSPEDFGAGAPEGVCASESANNAVTGGALIPLMTLGIPGDVNTLMLMGAMLVHGLIPGPALFRDESTLVYVIFGTMILCNLLILPMGLRLAPLISRVSLVDRKYLIPIILVLAVTGPSISYGHVYYFWISIVFGFVGYFCEKGGFPVMGIAMGLILGPIIERNLRSTMMLSDQGVLLVFTRPIALLFIALAVLVVIFGFRREYMARRLQNLRI